ncbi:MAG: hypothetical protein Rhims3KO_25690 [Hyphomicrobiales bacterium]
MHPGIVGALALIGTAGAIYFGSDYLNDYFAARNADTVVESAAQNEEATGTPSSLVGDAGEAPAEGAETEAADASDGDTMAEAIEEVAVVADDVTQAADDMASTVQETAEETLERVLQAAPQEQSETAAQESTPEPGTSPVLDIVRIEPTGEAVIAGNAPQGERVGLLYNNELIADSAVDAGGDFVLIPDQPIPSGEGTMEIVVIDDAGNTVTPSQEQVAVVLPEDGSTDGFLVGVLRPNEPVDIIERQAPEAEAGAEAEVEVAALVEPATPTEAPSSEAADAAPAAQSADEPAQAPDVEIAARVEPTQPVETEQATAPEAFVVVDAIELEGQDMWIAGGALPGNIIRLYQDNIFLGEVITGEEGRYLFEGTLLDSDGEVTVRADALVTGSADVIARAEVPFEVPLSSAQIAAAALDQVEEATTEIAAASTEQVEETAVEGAEAAQEQVADTVETVADAAADIAETVQEQTATAVEAVSEAASAAVDTVTETASEAEVAPVAEAPVDTVVATVADAVVDTAADAAERVQETVAAAVETTAEVADTTSTQIADTAETAVETVVETAEAVADDVAEATEAIEQATSVESPQVEIAATTSPAPSTPPTEALAQALEEAAAEATSEVEESSAQVMAETTAETAATATPAGETPAVETAAASTTTTEAPASAPAASPAQSERISVLDTGQVIIRRGDNLWRLSRRVYGQGIRYTSIYDANRDQIGQPELIFPGQVFTLPTPQEEWGAVPGLDALDADQIPGSGAEAQ